jgi:hypothetical protein
MRVPSINCSPIGREPDRTRAYAVRTLCAPGPPHADCLEDQNVLRR